MPRRGRRKRLTRVETVTVRLRSSWEMTMKARLFSQPVSNPWEPLYPRRLAPRTEAVCALMSLSVLVQSFFLFDSYLCFLSCCALLCTIQNRTQALSWLQSHIDVLVQSVKILECSKKCFPLIFVCALQSSVRARPSCISGLLDQGRSQAT